VTSWVVRSAVLGLLCGCGAEQRSVKGDTGAHMRPAPQGASSALYFTLRNPSIDTLVLYGVEIDVAGKASIHRSMNHNDMASMQQQDSIVIPPRDSVVFAERGLHIMADELVTAVSVGDTVVARLLLRKARVDTIRVAVRE
jgi:periplasmic copper chaperone A